MEEAERLRKLAAWYREFAERAGEPWIWEARLQTADELENAAALLEKHLTTIERRGPPGASVQARASGVPHDGNRR
jgi:hypothetical protein